MEEREEWTHLEPRDFTRYSPDPEKPDLYPGDCYKRSQSWLIVSLSHYVRNVLIERKYQSFGIPKQFLLTLLNLCDKKFTKLDIQYLCGLERANNGHRYAGSLLLGIDWMDMSEEDLLSLLPRRAVVDRLIFPYFQPSRKHWSVIHVSLSSYAIDRYTFGNHADPVFQPHLAKLLSVLKAKYRNYLFKMEERHRIPLSFTDNVGFASYVFGLLIHRNQAYLQLDVHTMNYYILTYYRSVLRLHDRYLGKLQLDVITLSSHPFIKQVNTVTGLDVVRSHGWDPIDVGGDGNCGYYALVAALENQLIKTFSPQRVVATQRSMRTSFPWQREMRRLREELRERGVVLVARQYNSEDNRPDWFIQTGAVTEEEIDELPSWFVCTNMSYWHPDFRLNSDYHLNPFWGGMVIASYFEARVVIISRLKTTDPKGKVLIQWSTTTYTYNAQLGQVDHITNTQREGIHRISDDEYKEMKTFELLYIHDGFTNDDTKHFLFLRRVFCYGTVQPIEKPTMTLWEAIMEESNRFGRMEIPSTEKQRRRGSGCAQENIATEQVPIDPRSDEVPDVPLINSDGANHDDDDDDDEADDEDDDEDEDDDDDDEGEFTWDDGAEVEQGKDAQESVHEHNVNGVDERASNQGMVHAGSTNESGDHSTDVVAEQVPIDSQSDEVLDVPLVNNDETNHDDDDDDDDDEDEDDDDDDDDEGEFTWDDVAEDEPGKGAQEAVHERNVNGVDITTSNKGMVHDDSNVESGDGTTDDDEVVMSSVEQDENELNIERNESSMDDADMSSNKENVNGNTDDDDRNMSNVDEVYKETRVDGPERTIDGDDKMMSNDDQSPNKSYVNSRDRINEDNNKKTASVRKGRKKAGHKKDVEVEKKASKEQKPNRLKYVPSKRVFLTCYYDTHTKRYSRSVEQTSINWIRAGLIRDARDQPGRWIAPPVQDAFDKHPPRELQTKVKTRYIQYNNPFCLSYSLGSCLHYCGFDFGAKRLVSQASLIADLHFDAQLKEIRGAMVNFCPTIGDVSVYNDRLSRHNRFIRTMSWRELFTVITPYPTLVIPARPNGDTTHAFCVVDDLIFDSITGVALKLKEETVQWIFNDENVELYMAIRFHQKRSPENSKVEETYSRPVKLNWEHDVPITIMTIPEKVSKGVVVRRKRKRGRRKRSSNAPHV
jgi:hypothetical protein